MVRRGVLPWIPACPLPSHVFCDAVRSSPRQEASSYHSCGAAIAQEVVAHTTPEIVLKVGRYTHPAHHGNLISIALWEHT